MARVLRIFCFYCLAVLLFVTYGLDNVVVKVGDKVTMTCNLNIMNSNYISWDHTPVQSKSVFGRINIGLEVMNNYSEFSLGGTIPGQDLILNSAQMKHAGSYRCSVKGKISTGQLIVLAFEPICNFTFNQSHFTLRCDVTYNGNWIPTLQLQQVTTGDETPQIISENDCEKETTDSHVTLIFTDSIMSLRPVTSYTVKMSFIKNSCLRIHVNVTSVVNYDYSWELPIAQLLDAPSNLRIYPLKTMYDIKDTLTCEADSKTTPDFEWKDESSAIVYRGSVLPLVNLSLKKEEFKISCRAVNRLSDKFTDSSQIHLKVNVTSDAIENAETSLIAYVSYSAAAIIAASTILFAIAFWLKKRRRLISNQANQNPEALTQDRNLAESSKPEQQRSPNILEHIGLPRSIEPTSAGERHNSGCFYEDVPLNAVPIPSNSTETSTNLETGYIASVSGEELSREFSIGKISGTSDTSSDSRSSRKRGRYEELLERSPMVKGIYLKLTKSRRDQVVQGTKSSTHPEGRTRYSPVYVNSIEIHAAKSNTQN